MEDRLLELFPKAYWEMWRPLVRYAGQIQEIRIRQERPVLVLMTDGEWFLGRGGITKQLHSALRVEESEMSKYINHFCKDSIYAFQEELKNGFITATGGHRVGVAGQVILDLDEIKGMKHITFLNIRLAHEIKGMADKVLPFIYEGKEVLNTLIISPPGCGKTTLLRDMVRQISDGNAYGEGVSVSVIDERSEIAGCYQGVPQNDVGIRTDVLDGCPKEKGMMLVLRSMSPRVIAVDELGGKSDEAALFKLCSCGCKVLATVHGENMEDLKTKAGWDLILRRRVFERYILLCKKEGRPTIAGIYDKEMQRLSLC